jgi:hypothetical protein
VAPEQQLKLALFGSVPLADLELVLPHKKVGLRVDGAMREVEVLPHDFVGTHDAATTLLQSLCMCLDCMGC